MRNLMKSNPISRRKNWRKPLFARSHWTGRPIARFGKIRSIELLRRFGGLRARYGDHARVLLDVARYPLRQILDVLSLSVEFQVRFQIFQGRGQIVLTEVNPGEQEIKVRQGCVPQQRLLRGPLSLD